MTGHTLIEIQEVVNLSANEPELLWGFSLETPDTSYKTDKYEVWFAGWILGKKAQVVSIEVIYSGRLIHMIVVDNPRPDVAKTYIEASNADTSGFFAQLTVSEMSTQVELHLQAVFSDRSRLPIAIVKFQKKLPFLEQVKADLAKSQARLKQIKTATEGDKIKPNDVKNQPSITYKTSNDSILEYASRLSDREWFEVIIKSVDNRFADGIELPGFPPDEIQRNTVGSSGKHALGEGFNFYSEIKRYVANLGQPLTTDSKILDFGCGWGRMIRFFLKDIVPDNLYGIDVNSEMIDICLKKVSQGNYSVGTPEPPTNFADNSFDVVYAYSVFSHLSESVHIKWVEEFSRVLKPGGILIVTTHARRFIELCRSLRGQNHEFAWYNALAKSFMDTDAAFADYDNGKFLYSATGGGSALPASFYGEAVISPGYVKREWTKYLTFCDFVDDPAKLNQAVIVMQKPVDDSLCSQVDTTEAEFASVFPFRQEVLHIDASLEPKIQYRSSNTSIALSGIEKLIWQKDRVICNDLVFRLEQSKNNNWELGEECFVLYKPKDLIDQYQRFFSSHQEFNPNNVVELGMWEGGSVAFWFEILQPNKHIAIDLQPRTDSPYFQKYVKDRGLHNRLNTYWNTNQADSGRINEIMQHEFKQQPLDLVMDDASHYYEFTKISFETLFPLVRPGGFYIIEDWAWWHWRGLEKYYSESTPLSKLIFELVEAAGTSKDIIKNIVIYQSIVIVERGDAILQKSDNFKLDNYIYRHSRT
ncbi:methyltransferase domain-containing protein [Microcoleus sp. CAWBG58]|uniref:methyltransferase domain-containing protein n=1 Tax=Microcoleus sp. CAWBG58 TaxID=2841651 RepID=UPI0025E37B0B|nr:methyltransferase domain-containing protein [Microcoleus sp. CAWBG58]